MKTFPVGSFQKIHFKMRTFSVGSGSDLSQNLENDFKTVSF
jgi:hypothetical protein